MAKHLVLLSESFPSDRKPLVTELDAALRVSVDDEDMSFDAVSVVPKLKAKELAKYLTLHLNRAEGKGIDFSGITVVADTSMDETTVTVLTRLSKVHLELLTGHEAIEESALDVTDGGDVWSADSALLAHWLEHKQHYVEPSEEEVVESQLDELLGDLDDLGLDDGDEDEETVEEPAREDGAATDAEDAQPLAEPTPEPERRMADSTEDADAGEDSNDDNDEARQQKFENSDTLVMSAVEAPEPEAQPKRKPEEPKQSARNENIIAMSGEDFATAEQKRARATAEHAQNKKPAREEKPSREEKAKAAPQKPRTQQRNEDEDDKLNIDYERIERERESTRDDKEDLFAPFDSDDDDDELFDPMADEIEPVDISQSELLNETRAADEDEDVEVNAYIDTELDEEESDYGTRNARSSEPTMVGDQKTPAFLERKRAEAQRAREEAEKLIPEPDTFASVDDITLEELESNDGGFPKEEALSETPATPTRTTSESPGEGSPSASNDVESASAEDKTAEDKTQKRSLVQRSTGGDVEEDSDKQKVGFTSTSHFTPHDSFEALKPRRHRSTRVGGMTGPSGGSGKTTSAYLLFLASSVIDSKFPRQREDQWTWLIELDYQNPKWKHRSNIAADDSFLGIIREFRRRKGNVDDSELVQLARKHSVSVLGSNNFPQSRLIAAPEANDYADEGIERKEFLVVADRLINALSRDDENPSTVILDLPDYSGEALDRNISDITNRYCDNVMVCFPENGDITDLHSVIELLRNQRQHKVNTQRIAVVGTRMNKMQAEELEKACRDMHINFAGRFPMYEEVNRKTEDAEGISERKRWIANASSSTKQKGSYAGANILDETALNQLAESYLRNIRNAQKRKNPARKDSERGTSSSGKRKRPQKKKSGGLKRLFGL